MVSAALGGIPLRVASWWDTPEIYSTTEFTKLACWSTTLGPPGAVDIATTGHWGGKEFGLTGGGGPNFNHAKIAVSTASPNHEAIFGDMNQQGDALVAAIATAAKTGAAGCSTWSTTPACLTA